MYGSLSPERTHRVFTALLLSPPPHPLCFLSELPKWSFLASTVPRQSLFRLNQMLPGQRSLSACSTNSNLSPCSIVLVTTSAKTPFPSQHVKPLYVLCNVKLCTIKLHSIIVFLCPGFCCSLALSTCSSRLADGTWDGFA
jgi:hypothetical protein